MAVTVNISITYARVNNFDRAKKIEAFLGLSGKYPYTLEPPPTPEDRNGVDYFLFDIKRGYCSYYASAMAVLLRSIGIPSRVVNGFAPGDWNAFTNSVTLTTPAHAWVEVYFPGYGWVEFEPTGGGPAQPGRTSSGMATSSTWMTTEETKKPDQPSVAKREEKPAAPPKQGEKPPAVKAAPAAPVTEKPSAQPVREETPPAAKSAGAPNVGQVKPLQSTPLLFVKSKLEGLQVSSNTSKTSVQEIAALLGRIISRPVSSGKPENSIRTNSEETKKPGQPASFERAAMSSAVETDPGVRDFGLMRWPYAIAILFFVVLSGWGGRLYWISSRRSRSGIPGSKGRAAGRSAVVLPNGTVNLDIRFPGIEADLPLYWGLEDPPIEVLLVKPEGVEISLTVNGEERALPVEKGEYLLEIRHEGRRAAKVVNIVDYGEEVERDFIEFIIQHGFKDENLTARQILDRIHKANPAFKRSEKALTLFEKCAYGRSVIQRDEYVRYYRSGRFGSASPDPRPGRRV